MHVVRYGRHSKPSPGRVLGTNDKPKTESADRQRRHPCGNCIAAQAQRSHAATDIASPTPPIKTALCTIRTYAFALVIQLSACRNDRGPALTSL